jgi:membrane fusion protein (multidrug efflux system)
MIPEEGLSSVGRRHFVMRVVNTGNELSVQRQEVEIGLRQPGEVEIVSGLDADDQIVIHGGFRLADGDSIKIRAVADGSNSLEDILTSQPTG